MTRYSVRDSSYLMAFLLASLMVWSVSAITQTMDTALEQTFQQLRTPIAELGTSIQDSAIVLRHRLQPQPQAEPAVVAEPVLRDEPVLRTAPPLPESLAPPSVQEVAALSELIVPPTRGMAKAHQMKLKKAKPQQTTAASVQVHGPPSSVKASSPGKDHKPKHAKRAGRKDT